MRNKKSK